MDGIQDELARERCAALERDRQRLDWLEEHIFVSSWDGTIGRLPNWTAPRAWSRLHGDTLRSAIDAAAKQMGWDK